MTQRSSAAAIKRSITDLVRGGCRVERVAHEPLGLTFVSPDGSRVALRHDGRLYSLVRPHGITRFHSLDAALSAAIAPTEAAAS